MKTVECMCFTAGQLGYARPRDTPSSSIPIRVALPEGMYLYIYTIYRYIYYYILNASNA
jgi:hypothetical protein